MTTSKNSLIQVITINYNQAEMTIDCVDSILNSTYENFEVCLIDNGSEKDDYQKLMNAYDNNPKVNILRIENNSGYVGGVNHGLQYASKQKANYFLIMNNDTIIDKQAIGYLLNAAIRYNNKAIVSGKVYYYDNPNVLQHTGEVIVDKRYRKTYSPGQNEEDSGQFDFEVERDILDDVFWIIPANIVDEIGFYCNYYFLYAEQADYAATAKRNGYKLIFTPKAKIWHKISMTTGNGNIKALPIQYWRAKGSTIYLYRNIMKPYFVVNFAKNIFKVLIKCIVNKNNQRSLYVARLRGYCSALMWVVNKKPDNGYNPYLK